MAERHVASKLFKGLLGRYWREIVIFTGHWLWTIPRVGKRTVNVTPEARVTCHYSRTGLKNAVGSRTFSHATLAYCLRHVQKGMVHSNGNKRSKTSLVKYETKIKNNDTWNLFRISNTKEGKRHHLLFIFNSKLLSFFQLRWRDSQCLCSCTQGHMCTHAHMQACSSY